MADLDFLPLDDDPTTNAEDLATTEELDDTTPDDLVITADPPPPVGRSWMYDFINGAFLPGGAHGPLETYADATLAVWIEKTLRTARGAHPIYPSEYGMDRPFDAVGRTLSTVDYADLQARVTEALTYHPRITDVIDFSAQQDDDEGLFVAFRVIKDDGSDIAVTELLL